MQSMWLLASTLSVAAPAPKAKPLVDDRLVGAWLAVSVVESGKTVSLAKAEPMTYHFEAAGGGSQTNGSKERATGRFELGPKVELRTIDIISPSLGKPGEPYVGLGVYRVEGDELTLCIRWGAGDRPAGFIAPTGSPFFVWTFKRVKPKDGK